MALRDLFVTIGANVQGFQQGMQTVQQNLATVGQNISQVGGTMTKFVTGPIVAAGAGMFALAQKTANAGDEIQKMAERTGISTEALSEYKHAAELSGTSIESVEKSVRRMQRTVLDAEQGMSTATDALNELGLTSEDLAGKTPEEQFQTLSTAIADVEDASKKAALAQDVFGRSGTQLLPMLNNGSEGIAEMREEARELGIVFDQEAADASAQFNDDLDRMKKGFQGVFQELGMKLIPIFVDELIPAIQEHILPLVVTLAEKLVTLIEWFSNLSPTMQKVVGIVVGLAAAIGPVLIVVGKLITAFTTILPIIKGVGALIAGLATGAAAPFLLVAAAIAAAVIIWRNFGDDIKKFVGNMVEKVVGFITTLKDAFVGTFTAIKDRVVGVFEGLWNGLKKIINWIISGINVMIRGLNSISIDIPEWVPKLGGQKFGFNIGEIPMLAEGGNINFGGAAIIGEEGPELLELPKGARVSPFKNGGSGAKEINMNITQNITDKATAEYANNSLVRKLQGRGLAGALR